MKRILTIATLAFSVFNCTLQAQTQTGTYIPGATQEGATFFLPKTAIRVAVMIEKTTYKPGDFSLYAERFLRLNNVEHKPSTTFRVLKVSQMAVSVPDTTKAYSIKFNNKTAAINVALNSDGILTAINAQPHELTLPIPFKAAPKPAPVNPRQFMNEEILAAGSTARMAQLTAQEIYDLRDSRNLLIKGQADFMPKDGEQMKLMLNQLNQHDQALTSLFAGTAVRDTTEEVFIVSPDKELQRAVVFRFSKHLGLLEADDMTGIPYYISIKNLTQLPAVNAEAAQKKKKAENGLYYNVPGKMSSTLYCGNELLSEEEYPAGQFGHVELLSGDLFNKHYGTRLWLNPLSGGIEKLEAEQPK